MKEVRKVKTVIKKFSELTNDEMYRIIKQRIDVFVVEQNCPYPELDGTDDLCYHVYIEDDGEISAYLRVIPPYVKYEEASLGRVLSAKNKRGKGLGRKVTETGIKVAEEKFGAKKIRIEAQTQARGFYEKLGFVKDSEEFLEDGIPHIEMVRIKS